MSRLLIAVVVASLLAGCATTDTRKVQTAPIVTKPKLNLKDPPPLQLKDVDWIVITPENQEVVFKKLRASGDRAVLYALTDEGYKAVRLNDAKVIGYVRKQKGLIAAFRKYYE